MPRGCRTQPTRHQPLQKQSGTQRAPACLLCTRAAIHDAHSSTWPSLSATRSVRVQAMLVLAFQRLHHAHIRNQAHSHTRTIALGADVVPGSCDCASPAAQFTCSTTTNTDQHTSPQHRQSRPGRRARCTSCGRCSAGVSPAPVCLFTIAAAPAGRGPTAPVWMCEYV